MGFGLAVTVDRATGAAVVFWLDDQRAHDRNLNREGANYLKDHETPRARIQNSRA